MNNDLISRSALNEVMWDESHDIVLHNEYGKDEACIGLTYNEIENIIDNAPTVSLPDFKAGYKQAIIDGKTNFSRPQGEWIDYSDDGFVECSVCGCATTCDDNKDELHFCWNCGADMRGENTDS